MLKLTLKIHGDGKDSLPQAKAVIATLLRLYGNSVLEGVPRGDYSIRVGGVEISGGPEILKSSKATPAASAPAPDGMPMTEPEAAAVFGEPDASTVFAGGPTPADDETNEAPGPVGDVDKNGLPWDARIHAETKGQNKDGTWKRRRNTSDETFNAVMAELQAAKGNAPTPPATPATPAPPPPSTAPAPTNSAAPAPSPAPAAPAASSTAPAAPASGNPFVNVMTRVTKAQAAGTLTQDVAASFYEALGIKGIAELAGKKELIPQFAALLDSVGA